MILTDREIKLALEKGLIIIDPRPNQLAFSSTAVDLTLDPNITEFKKEVAGIELIIDPGHREFQSESTLAQISDRRVIDPEEGYLLKHGTLVLAWTAEYINRSYYCPDYPRWLRRPDKARNGQPRKNSHSPSSWHAHLSAYF